MNVNDIKRMLVSTSKEFEVDLKTDLSELALYTSEQASKLSLVMHEPGFVEAVRASGHSIALKAGIDVSQTETRVLDVLNTVLLIGIMIA